VSTISTKTKKTALLSDRTVQMEWFKNGKILSAHRYIAGYRQYKNAFFRRCKRQPVFIIEKFNLLHHCIPKAISNPTIVL